MTKTGQENEFKNNDMGFEERVLARVGRHLVHSLNSSEPELTLRAEKLSCIRRDSIFQQIFAQTRLRPASLLNQAPGVGSSFSQCVEGYDKLSSAKPQSRKGRKIVARYVSEGALRDCMFSGKEVASTQL